MISFVAILTNLTSISIDEHATALAILSRMVPSITRSFSSFSQLQFGVPAVLRIEKLNSFSDI